jgi:hypothetical protein
MARPKRPTPARRLNLEIPDAQNQRLETLKEKTEAASLTQVIQRALAVYDLVITEKFRGSTVIIRDAEGKDRELILM